MNKKKIKIKIADIIKRRVGNTFTVKEAHYVLSTNTIERSIEYIC